MMYTSLLLNCGGGITNPAAKSKQFSQTAALCIGIGGTGVAALSDLKGKIYQQLIPDDPDVVVPTYNAIQLLAIDSDETAYQQYNGDRKLSKNEFFSIQVNNLGSIFTEVQSKQDIKNDPIMTWMEIDKITKQLSPFGAGGVRQVGRYLLLSKAASLYTEIQNRGSLALKKRGTNTLDIYIFAGISGGTGSGCFLDTCYLVRKVVDDNGWNANIMGYFFLPDVVTSKKEVSANPASAAYNNSNGYAAMKELDYLMHLEENGDWFEQNYGNIGLLRTQRPPVDMCHLISATKANGDLVPNGFQYGINVATDYAMAYLAEVELGSANADTSSLTMRGHLANVSRGVLGIPKRWGANLSYHILGASNAEIPMTQINTYLAAGFLKKFTKKAKHPRNIITDATVDEWMGKLGLTAKQVYESVIEHTEALSLPELEWKDLAEMPVAPQGKLNATWREAHAQWLKDCVGTMDTNVNALTKKLDGYAYGNINPQSLIGRLFRTLWELCLDPNYGPYYAAYLLSNNGQDLNAALTGEITKADKMEESKSILLPDLEKNVVELNENLVNHGLFNGKRCYEDYHSGVMDWLSTDMAAHQCHKTGDVLRDIRDQVANLYTMFFRPLCDLLDNLDETFRENTTYLSSSQQEASHENSYTWQILTLDDVKERLDKAIAKLNDTQLVTEFLTNLLEHSDSWLKNEDSKIVPLICRYMLELFRTETNRSLQDYLYDKYPWTVNQPDKLAEEIQADILDRVHKMAIPMFWCDKNYKISDPTYTFECSSLSVPSSSSVICGAADAFSQHYANYTVRKTGIGDRIFALRFISGVPLFAYQGITKLKGAYDSAAGKPDGAGSHLYAKTGRGNPEKDRDWRKYLPTPMPYSRNETMIPDGKQWASVYREAVKRGIIGELPDDYVAKNAQQETGSNTDPVKQYKDYAIFVTPKLTVKTYALSDFLHEDVFLADKYDEELKNLQKQIKTLHAYGENPDCTIMQLKNDGAEGVCQDKEAVRIDYFIQYTVLHKLTADEIEKDKKLKEAEAQLMQIYEEYAAYVADLKDFTTLLFYGVLECRDAFDAESYEDTVTVRFGYVNQYGDSCHCYLAKQAKKYALHDAFAAYRKKENGDVRAWKTLDASLKELQGITLKPEDAYVAAILEQVWNDKAMEELCEVTLLGALPEVRSSVLRFYKGLRSNIVESKKKFKDKWPKGLTVKDLMAKLHPNEDDNKPSLEPFYVWQDNKTLIVYPDRYLDWAFDAQTNGWVHLTDGGPIYIARNGQWDPTPLKLDASGRIIL